MISAQKVIHFLANSTRNVEKPNSVDIIALGLGLQAPWEIAVQLLDTDKSPHELCLTMQATRGACYACPMAERSAMPMIFVE